MESSQCEQRITKVSLAEILRCFEHPISEEQAWAICFQCCRKMEQLATGLYPPLHSVFIEGPGSIFIHADGTASFKSDVGSIQQSEEKLLEHLGVVIYEALDWGIDSKVERELSHPLNKLLCLMLKLDDEAMKPAVTLQDVTKACEEHLSRPSEATSHYEVTCRSLFTEYMELQKLVTIIQASKERLRKMEVEDLVENPFQKKENHQASWWPSVFRELQNGVRLRKATERPQHRMPPKERVRSPYELLLDDIQHKRYTLRKVIIQQNHRPPEAGVAAPKPHLKPMLERKLKECVPQEASLHEQLMAELKQPQKLRSAATRENGSRPKEMLVTPNIALKSPSRNFLTLQDASTDTTTQQLGPGVQETTPKLPSSTWLASTRSLVISCNNTGLAANCTCPPMSAPTLGDIKHNGFLNADQQQLPHYRGRSKSLERDLQSKELECPFPTKWPSPTIAELIETRYAMMVLEGQSGSDGVFPRAKICFSCHKQMFLKWPYSCCLCSSQAEVSTAAEDVKKLASEVAGFNFSQELGSGRGSSPESSVEDWKSELQIPCLGKELDLLMSMPCRTCVHLPLHFLKLLKLSREEDPAAQQQKSSELLHEIEHWESFGVPVILEPRCLAQPLCCYTGTVADWLTVDICMRCEQYLLNVASSKQQSIPLRRTSWP